MSAADAKKYFDKAVRTLSTAQKLLKQRDTEGACNRAYYAMFYAAHVPLLSISTSPRTENKTHRGLIAAFGKHVVIDMKMDPELGRSLNDVENIRLAADYLGDPPPPATAKSAVEQAARFIEAIRAAFVKV